MMKYFFILFYFFFILNSEGQVHLSGSVFYERPNLFEGDFVKQNHVKKIITFDSTENEKHISTFDESGNLISEIGWKNDTMISKIFYSIDSANKITRVKAVYYPNYMWYYYDLNDKLDDNDLPDGNLFKWHQVKDSFAFSAVPILQNGHLFRTNIYSPKGKLINSQKNHAFDDLCYEDIYKKKFSFDTTYFQQLIGIKFKDSLGVYRKTIDSVSKHLINSSYCTYNNMDSIESKYFYNNDGKILEVDSFRNGMNDTIRYFYNQNILRKKILVSYDSDMDHPKYHLREKNISEFNEEGVLIYQEIRTMSQNGLDGMDIDRNYYLANGLLHRESIDFFKSSFFMSVYSYEYW